MLLPGGEFTMGSQGEDSDAAQYDPQHRDNEPLLDVTLSPFFLARHELTQGQWKRLSAGERPSLYAPGASPGGVRRITWSNPVEQVNWLMCDRLMSRHGLVLPTEAQWEYGCRAGTTTPWTCGLEELHAAANVADATAKRALPGWTCEAWSDGHAVHAPVGSFLPNAFGLFDVHGNVWEWTRDGDFGARAPRRAGDGRRGDPAGSSFRVIRGGDFSNQARTARSANRYGNSPTLRNSILGLRPARLIEP